jgi:GNAT superfamily N-acetyltransferase
VTAHLDIRQATPEDVPLLLDFIRELAQYERLTHLLAVTERQLALELFGANSRVEALLAHCDGEPAAFAVYFHNFSTFLGRRGLYLEDLFVRPPFRRRGCGRAMLVELARIAHERACGRFEWTVLDWNKPAIDFYRSLGADVLEDWRICRVTGAALEQLAESAMPRPDLAPPADPQEE